MVELMLNCNTDEGIARYHFQLLSTGELLLWRYAPNMITRAIEPPQERRIDLEL
jgi:hypothetical protein